MARILIAEDDPQASDIIARICEYKGHEIQEARDALDALDAFDSFKPDLVITDLAMPLGGGQHFLREMRTRPDAGGCPVIVVTGYASSLGEHERASLEPCTILRKPLELEPMLTALENALGSPQSSD